MRARKLDSSQSEFRRPSRRASLDAETPLIYDETRSTLVHTLHYQIDNQLLVLCKQEVTTPRRHTDIIREQNVW